MSQSPFRNALGEILTGVRDLLRVRWVKVLFVLFVIALGVRMGFEFALARVIDSLATPRELAVDWNELNLSVLGGRGEIRGLRVVPEAEGEDAPQDEALVELEYAVFDLEVLALLGGELRISRAEVDGFDSRLERDAEGVWNFERHVAIAEVLALFEVQEAEPEEEEEEDEPLDLSLPIVMDALRFQHARLSFLDHQLGEPRELWLEMNAALSHLNTAGRPAEFSLTVTGGELLDGAELDGWIQAEEERLSLILEANAGGLQLEQVAPYLALVDVRPGAKDIEMAGRVELVVDVLGETRDTLGVTVKVHDASMKTDGIEAFACDEMTLEVPELNATQARVAPLVVRGPRGRVELLTDGALRIAGIDLLPARETTPAETPRAPLEDTALGALEPAPAPRWARLFLQPDTDAYPWTWDGLEVEGGRIACVDHATTPKTELALELERLELGRIAHDPRIEYAEIPLSVKLAAPGVADAITIDGRFQPFAPERRMNLTVDIDGIGLEATDPYLQRAGLERTRERSSLTMSLSSEAITDQDGVTRGWLELDEVALGQGGELFGMQGVSLRDIVLDPANERVRLGEIAIEGPTLVLERDPTRNLLAFGLRVFGAAALEEAEDAGAADVAPPPAPSAAPADTEPITFPRIELDHITWSGSRLAFLDRASDPPVRIEIDRLGMELSGLVLGGREGDEVPAPATFRGEIVAQGISENITLEGDVVSRPGPLDVEATIGVEAGGLTGEVVAPYMQALGIRPTLVDGAFRLSSKTRLRDEGGSFHANLRLDDVELSERAGNASAPLFSLESLEADVRLGADGPHVEKAHIVAPVARLARDADGRFHAAGVTIEPTAPSSEPVASEPQALTLPALPPLRVDELVLEGAALELEDAVFEPALNTRFEVAVQVNDLATDGTPGRIQATLRIPEAVDALGLTAEVRLGQDDLRLAGAFHGEGLRAGPFASLLPPGVSFDAGDGTLDGTFSLGARPADEGGIAAAFRLDDLRWGRPAMDPWFGCKQVAVDVARFDPLAREITIGTCRVDGTQVAIERDAEGAILVAGARLGLPEPVDSAEPVEPGQPDESNEPIEAGAQLDAGTGGSERLAPPRIRLDEGVAFELERLTFRDASLGEGARVLDTSLVARFEPATVIQADPGELPPLGWSLRGSIDGLVDSWSLQGALTPFADEPRYTATLQGTGVRTQGLVELVPELGELFEGEVDQGTFGGSFEAHLFVRRARPYELGIERAFSGEVRMHDLHYRASPDGEILMGVDGIELDLARVDPRKGLVHAEMLEILTPRAKLSRDAEGLHLLGLRIDTSSEAAPVEESEDEPVAVEASAPSSTPDEETSPTGEVRIDRFLISGLDLDIRDTAIEPELHLPLDVLDVEVSRFTTRAFTEKKPVSFAAFLGTSGGEEKRPVFEEAVAAGRLTFAPTPGGQARLQLFGLELARFAGFTAEQGVAVEDGALDTDVRLRLRGDAVKVDTSLVFDDLDVSEPAGGFFEKTFSLPMALDSALFLLRNPAGEHRISMGFTVDSEGISTAEIVGAATLAMTNVLVGALAGAPLRLVTSVLPGSEKKDRAPLAVHLIDFAPASTRPSRSEHERLLAISDEIRKRDDLVVKLVHEVGADDWEQIEKRANPSEADCLELTRDLRRRRKELDRRITARQLEARSLYAIGDDRDAGSATDELRDLEAERADVERSLDQVLDVLRSSSPRQRAKRTRNLARKLAELRLAEVTATLGTYLRPSEVRRFETTTVRVKEIGAHAESRVRITIERK